MAAVAHSTLPDRAPLERVRRSRALRRAGLVALALGVALGSWLGDREEVVSIEEGDLRLVVNYPAVARPGFAVDWRVAVQLAGGFGEPVRIAVTRRYLEALDLNAVHPQPAVERVWDDRVIWEFEPPRGEALTIELDGRHEPGVVGLLVGQVAVLQGDRAVVEAAYSTLMLP